MADAPWRCSQCGTVNEPVANACRTCGRWPSLFDLEASKVEDFTFETPAEAEAQPEPVTVAVEEIEPFEPEVFDVDQPEDEPETTTQRGRRIIGSILVPLAVVAYLVISAIAER